MNLGGDSRLWGTSRLSVGRGRRFDLEFQSRYYLWHFLMPCPCRCFPVQFAMMDDDVLINQTIKHYVALVHFCPRLAQLLPPCPCSSFPAQFAMIDDDVLINQTIDNWCWGADSSGDLRKRSNIEFLWQEAALRAGVQQVGMGGGWSCRCHQWLPLSLPLQCQSAVLSVPPSLMLPQLPLPLQGGALLVTADGAVDCAMDPNRQVSCIGSTAPHTFLCPHLCVKTLPHHSCEFWVTALQLAN